MTDVEQLRNRVVDAAERTCSTCGASSTGRREEREAEFAKYTELAAGARPAAGDAAALGPEHRAAARPRCRRTRPGSTACSRHWSAPGARRRPGARFAAPRQARLDHHGEPGQARLAGRGDDRLPLRARHLAERRHHPVERSGDRGGGRDAGARGGGGQGAAGRTVRDLRPHDRAGARERVLLGLLPPPVGGGEAGRRRSRRARRSGRWAARTPTTARTCTSRSGGRTRSRSIRRRGCRKR